MVKGVTVGHDEVCPVDCKGANYDYAKAVIAIARKNGWNIENLDLIPKNLSITRKSGLSRKQVAERNRLVKSIFKRFGSILSSPIPFDLEKSIRSKAPSTWLPWEAEAIEKIGRWRDEIARVRPEILNELGRALLMETKSTA
jgi:hypothetical protein